MKTSQNIARVSAQLIRAAAKDLRESTEPVPHMLATSRPKRSNALESLEEIANQLEQYEVAFWTPDAPRTQ